MESSSPKVAVSAVQWDMNPKKPVLFRSYPTPDVPDAIDGPSERSKIWDAARATSAAPTYFRPHEVNGHYYVDGGLVGSNPVLAALSEAVALYGSIDKIGTLLR